MEQELSESEIKVLESIRENMANLEEIEVYLGIKKEISMKILKELEKKEFIKIKKTFDNHYREESWESSLTNKGKEILEKYGKN